MSIFELNKIISSMSGMNTNGVRGSVIESVYNSKHYSEQISSFDDVLYSAVCLGLLDMDESSVSITDTGAMFAEMMLVRNRSRMLNGTDEQRKFLVECLDNDRMHNIGKEILKKFHVNYSVDPPVWNSSAGVFDRFELCILGILEEIGIIGRDRNIVTVETEKIGIVSAMKNGFPVSVSYLSGRRKEIGNAGETKTLDYEMKRLKDIKRDDLSEMVKQTSLVDPYAGYDIASFDGHDSDDSFHDRLIEVKSTTGVAPRFFGVVTKQTLPVSMAISIGYIYGRTWKILRFYA